MRVVMLVGVIIAALQPAAPLVQSIDVTVRHAAVTFQQAGQTHLAHELHITNFQAVDVTLRAVALHDDTGRELARYQDEELARRITRPGFRNDYATPQVMGPGLRALVHVWLALPPPSFFRNVTYTVDVDLTRDGKVITTRVRSRAIPVSHLTAVEIDPPLRGGPWIAIYDPLLKGGHRTAVYTLDGRAAIPGRFAIDFIAFPETGALPKARAADANGFGAEVLAVADGTIAIAVDGVPDATPPPITLELAPGNHIALDLGNNRFAFYEHLQRGSVMVKAGDQVTRGQAIARLGSSGSSSIGPHLHFHVADAALVLGAEGVPFMFRRFIQLGRFESLMGMLAGDRWRPAGAVVTFQQERPDANAVIRFP